MNKLFWSDETQGSESERREFILKGRSFEKAHSVCSHSFIDRSIGFNSRIKKHIESGYSITFPKAKKCFFRPPEANVEDIVKPVEMETYLDVLSKFSNAYGHTIS